MLSTQQCRKMVHSTEVRKNPSADSMGGRGETKTMTAHQEDAVLWHMEVDLSLCMDSSSSNQYLADSRY